MVLLLLEGSYPRAGRATSGYHVDIRIRQELGEAMSVPILLHDIDDLSRLFASWDGRFEQLSAGRFEAEVQVARGQVIRGFRARTSQALLARGHDGPGVINFCPIVATSGTTLWQGRRGEPGSMVIRAPDVGIDNRPGKGAEVLALSIHAETLRRAAWALAGVDLGKGPRGWEMVYPDPRSVFTFVRRLHLFLAGEPEAEQHCLRALLEALPTIQARHGASASARAALVRRAEEILRSILGRPLTSLELCEALGATDRTLRLAFHERFGMGPLAYHRVLRLNAAREALRKGEPVALVAGRFGFRHLGRFAGEYAWQFGEKPSETRLSS